MKYLFPASFMANTFAMTAVMIALSLAGKPDIAADVGIVHGATVALFYAFSANARSIILNPSSGIPSESVLGIRLMLLLPLGWLSFLLSTQLAGVETLLAFVLVLRRCAEWIAEVHVSKMELHRETRPAARFLAFQTVLTLAVIGWLLGNFPAPQLAIFVWATSPLWLSFNFVLAQACFKPVVARMWLRLLPHVGSTAITGLAVYVFRLLILLLAGKTIAGDLYAAFAIGGLLGSVFAQAIGPSLVLQEVRGSAARFPAWLTAALGLSMLLGTTLFVMATLRPDQLVWTGKSGFFWMATGLSLFGGVVMVAAQYARLRLLQHHTDKDVFGPDVLVNILLVGSVPYLFNLLGMDAMAYLYLVSSVLGVIFYYSAAKSENLWAQKIRSWDEPMRATIALLLLVPIFFQLNGAIFRDPTYNFDTGGLLTRLPIPVSVLACYVGTMLLGGYARARLTLTTIFLTFTLMLISSVVLTHDQSGQEQAKLILLIQFVLPMFALVLGQVYEGSRSNTLICEKVVLYILSVLVPIQLVVSWLQGHRILSPYLYLFSIYQHLQYVPVILICGYLLSLYSLWTVPQFKMLLILLAPLMGIYAVASVSLLAFSAMIVGVLGFANYRWWFGSDKQPMLVVLLVLLGSACYLPVVMSSSLQDKYFFQQKFAFLGAQLTPKELQLREKFPEGAELTPAESQLRDELDQSPLAKRSHYWEYYAKGIVSGFNVFLFGHAESPDRLKSPSAHNYYLDFIYRFGSLAILPLMTVLGYTLVMVLRFREAIRASPSLLGLTVVVLFLLLVDNSLKVGLRQPYPGIITFFFWGLLLARIESLWTADKRRLPAARAINPDGFVSRVRRDRDELSRKSTYVL